MYMAVLRPKSKSKGSGIIVSDFIEQHSGFLRLSGAFAYKSIHVCINSVRVLGLFSLSSG